MNRFPMNRSCSRGVLVVVVTLAACRPPVAGDPAPAADEWRYDVRVAADATILDVTATLVTDARRELVVDGPARPFVSSVTVDNGASTGDAIACAPPRCVVRYRFALDAAARAVDDPDVAAVYDGAYVSPASSWLVHPRGVVARTIELRFNPGAPVLAPWPVASDRGPDVYVTHGAGLDESPWFGFGKWTARTASVDGARLTVGLSPAKRAMDDAAVARWITDGVATVTTYLRASPVPHPLVLVAPGDADGISGRTLGGGGGAILLQVGPELSARAATESWIPVHEAVHLELPSLGWPHSWLEEGLATYVEPIARARAGVLTPERVWGDVVRDAAQGLPADGDEGLEHTHSWGRTYWGGAIFCLATDVAIRTRTGNRRSLDDALRAIARASHGVADTWTIERFLEVGDRATGLTVLEDEYRRQALAPGRVDLEKLWHDLGVTRVDDRVVFDDGAPLAWVRRAITAPEPRNGSSIGVCQTSRRADSGRRGSSGVP